MKRPKHVAEEQWDAMPVWQRKQLVHQDKKNHHANKRAQDKTTARAS